MPVGVRHTRNPAAVPGFAPPHRYPQVARRANTFEGGTDTVSITTTNSGGASGDAFDVVAAAITFSATREHGGALSASNLTPGAGPTAQTMQWQLLALTNQPLYYRAYLWVDATPSANQLILTFIDTATTTIMRVNALTAGTLRLQDGAGATLATTTATLATGAWNRIEVFCDPRPGGGFTQELYLFNGANLEEPIEGTNTDHISSTTAVLGNGVLDQVRWGTTTGAALSYQQYWDDIGISTDGWLGPAPVGGPVTITVPSPATATADALAPVLLSTLLPSAATAAAAALTPLLAATVLPAASAATATALAPVIKGTILPSAAAATAAALAPALFVTVLPAAATATAQALPPTLIIPVTIVAPAAAATATALAPTLLVTLLPAAATATATALLPTLKPTVLPAAATATAQALSPTITATILPAAATATAQSLVPALLVTVTPAAATATAQALVPTLLAPVTILAPAATATAAALIPTLKLTVTAVAATATAAALIPAIKVTITPDEATAAALALAPTIIPYTVPIVTGVTVISGQISHALHTPGLLGQLHGQLLPVLAVSTVRGRYTFSNNYSTGGETPTINIQRKIVQVLFAALAGGYGIIWTGTKVQAWNLDGSGSVTTEVAAATDLSAVTVPMIVYVIAH